MGSDGKLRRYRVVFNKCSVIQPGIYLTNEELIMALRRVNNKLIGASEIKYIFYILDFLNPDAGDNHDFKAFSAIAALSERVAPMEKFIKGFVDQADFGSLRQKLEGAHHMFLNLFRGEDGIGANELMAIPVDDLEYVFLAGGIQDVPGILKALRDANMDPLTYLDYLAYIPMFIDIHSSVVQNPFNEGGMGSEIKAVDQTGTEENEQAIKEGRRIRIPNQAKEGEPRTSVLGGSNGPKRTPS